MDMRRQDINMKHGNMEKLRHRDMDMETMTWRHGYGDLEWRHGHVDMKLKY